MSAIDFEYAIKKDVRNNPIVREVDEARQRQLLRSMGIGVFLVAGHPVLGVAALRAAAVTATKSSGCSESGRRRKKSTGSCGSRSRRCDAPARVEHIATKQLHLVAPTRDQAIILERVTPSAPPEKSIVAAR